MKRKLKPLVTRLRSARQLLLELRRSLYESEMCRAEGPAYGTVDEGAALELARYDAARNALTEVIRDLAKAPKAPPHHRKDPMNLQDLPALGQPLEGGIFAGLTTDKAGQHFAVALLPDKPEKLLGWKKAMAWAEGINATLPTRPVAALLFSNTKDQFDLEPSWHWTCEVLDGSYAWYQGFGNGLQYYYRKSYEGRARAVRLIQLTA